MVRGEIWWASLPAPQGSGPGYRRPVVIVQSDPFNESRINTVVIAAITSNTRLSAAPGNILLSAEYSGLARESVINVSQVLTVDRSYLTERINALSRSVVARLDDGLRLVMGL